MARRLRPGIFPGRIKICARLSPTSSPRLFILTLLAFIFAEEFRISVFTPDRFSRIKVFANAFSTSASKAARDASESIRELTIFALSQRSSNVLNKIQLEARSKSQRSGRYTSGNLARIIRSNSINTRTHFVYR